jgi:hypothetical protein
MQSRMNLKRATVALLTACAALGASSLASACSIDVTEYSPLERNLVTLSGDTLIKVAKRLIDAPIWFNGQWEVYVIGHAFPSESHPKELAERRKAYAIQVLMDVLKLAPERVTNTGSDVYSQAAEQLYKATPADFAGVEILVEPVCPPGGCHLCNAEPPPKEQPPAN